MMPDTDSRLYPISNEDLYKDFEEDNPIFLRILKIITSLGSTSKYILFFLK